MNLAGILIEVRPLMGEPGCKRKSPQADFERQEPNLRESPLWLPLVLTLPAKWLLLVESARRCSRRPRAHRSHLTLGCE